MGENGTIDLDTFHHSYHLKLSICYIGHFDDNKTVEIVYVAICVRSYHAINITTIHCATSRTLRTNTQADAITILTSISITQVLC